VSPLLARLALVLREADGIVPPTGFTARLTIFAAAAMAFLAVFALALSLAAGRLASRWEEALARSATVRIAAPEGEVEAQVSAALEVLGQTPGVALARRLEPAELQALLAPWLGPDLPLETVPLPELIEVTETPEGFDAEGLRLRLAAEAPAAVLDDHTRWRRPLIDAAQRLRTLGVAAIALIAGATAATIALAAQASLSANRKVIEVLRLIGAHDGFIARAFVRRFTLRALVGAAAGAALGTLAVVLLPGMDEAGGFLTGLAFQGAGWLWPLAIPLLAAVVALAATAAAAHRVLKELP
jgi:cell division transport system permease protein